MTVLRAVALIMFVALILTSCAVSPKVKIYDSFDPRQERDAVYVIPFNATLTPPDISAPVFNEFVDRLNALRMKTRVAKFLILKEDLKDVEPAWLIKQTYITGDIWGYMESSGCCSTEMRVKSRIYLYEPGKNDPSMEVYLPEEDFFEHDRVPASVAKGRMAKKTARALADAIIKKLTP